MNKTKHQHKQINIKQTKQYIKLHSINNHANLHETKIIKQEQQNKL